MAGPLSHPKVCKPTQRLQSLASAASRYVASVRAPYAPELTGGCSNTTSCLTVTALISRTLPVGASGGLHTFTPMIKSLDTGSITSMTSRSSTLHPARRARRTLSSLGHLFIVPVIMMFQESIAFRVFSCSGSYAYRNSHLHSFNQSQSLVSLGILHICASMYSSLAVRRLAEFTGYHALTSR